MNPIRVSAFFFGAAAFAVSAMAQTPPPPDGAPALGGPPPLAGPRYAQPESTTTGRVTRWLVNPNGDVDGLLLDDGTQVNVPPHLSAALTDTVKTKDAVEIVGRRGENARVVSASTITNKRSGRSVGIEAPEPGYAPPPPRPAGALASMDASGRIDALLYTPRGDVNGALLQDGTVVRFPPHAVAQMSGDVLKPGAPIYARGYGTRSAQGSALEATAIGTTAADARDVFAAPGVGPDRGARRPMPPRADRRAPLDPPPPPPLAPRAPA